MGKMKNIAIELEEQGAEPPYQSHTELEISFKDGVLAIKEYDNLYAAPINDWIARLLSHDVLQQDVTALRAALEGLRINNECWCGVAIDNPMHQGKHSENCMAAMRAMAGV